MIATPALEPRRLPVTTGGNAPDLITDTVNHRHYARAREECLEHLLSPADIAFVFLVGATGAGKSRLLGDICETVLAEYTPEMAADPDVIPVLRLNAPAPPDGTFRWRALAGALFEQARTASRGRPSVPVSAIPALEARSRTMGKTYDDILAEALRACQDRGVRVVMLDEAGHLANVAFTPRHRQQLDVLKGLALNAGMRFVLAGPYELLAFRDASAQLNRRSRLVHVAPYHLGRKRDQVAWASVVATMLDITGLEVNLPDVAAYLHAGSVGCVGMLRDWLVDARFTFDRRKGRATFTECLREKRPSAGQLRAIRQELALGEGRLAADAKEDRSAPAGEHRRDRRTTSGGQVLRPGDPNPRRNYLSRDAA